MNKKLIKNKNFVLLILGKLVSMVGSNLMQFALSLYVLDKTGSATVFASMLSISIFPRLILTPFAGVFGDWFDRKKSIVALDFINAIIIAVFARIFFLQNGFSISLIYILVILLEITEIFFGSAMAGILPSIVEEEDLLDANSFNSVVMNIANLLSPILASLLYANFGMQILLIINASSFLISSISEIFIDIPKNHKRPEKINFLAFKTDLKKGIDVINTNDFLKSLMILAAFLNFSLSPLFSVGYNFILRDYLSISAFKYSIFQTILSSSMLLAPFIVASLSKKYKEGNLIYKSFVSMAIFVFLSSISTMDSIVNINENNLLPFLILISTAFIIGFIVTIANIVVGTMFNKIIPIDMMGRVGSILGLLSTILIPIGQMLFGFMYDNIHPSIVTIIIGSLFLIATLLSRKVLVEYDRIKLRREENLL